MKPVMFKFNSDRQNEYRIKTVIYKDAEKKYVIKEALTEEADTHIKKIYENYTVLKNIYPEFYICPVEFKGNSLCFEFVDGVTFSKKYENAIAHASKEEFIAALIEQKKLIFSCKEDNFCQFKPEKDFINIFGDGVPYVNQKAMKCSDFEFTSHNIINKKDGQVALIDYEYVFRFPVPVSLILYHCIIKTNIFTVEGFEGMLDMDEIFGVLEIENTVDELEASWLHFQNHYSIGLIEKAKCRYLKAANDVTELFHKCIQSEQEIKGHLHYIDILTHSLNDQQQYIQELIKQLDIERMSLENSNAEIVKQEQEIKGHLNYISILTSNLHEQKQYIDLLIHENEENKCNVEKCQAENERLLKINSEITDSHDRLKLQIDSIENSLSWKLTGPIRKVLQLLNIRNK